MDKILILEDNPIISATFSELLEMEGYKVVVTSDSEDFFEAYDELKPDLILLDIELPGSRYNGMEVLEILSKEDKLDAKAIILSGAENKEVYVNKALELGAYNFLDKDSGLHLDKFLLDVKQAIAHNYEERENKKLTKEKNELKKLHINNYPLLGSSAVMQELRKKIEVLANEDVNVLIVGETGTGKNIIAQHLYASSNRFGKPFHHWRFSAMDTKNIFDQFKFAYPKSHGHYEGATTAFSAYKNGVFFMDEIDHMDEKAQKFLLKLHEDSCKNSKYDIKMFYAIRDNLPQLIEENKFREDLYFRLEENKIVIPPLRERGNDIIELMEHFFLEFEDKYYNELDYKLSAIKGELKSYSWPGNVRELKNFCHRVALNKSRITNKAILKELHKKTVNIGTSNDNPLTSLFQVLPLNLSLDMFEKQYLMHHLRQNEFKKTKTAENLGIERTTLYKKLKKHGLDKYDG